VQYLLDDQRRQLAHISRFFYKLVMPFLLFKFAPFPLRNRLVMVR
jgi:hypothetical protein